MHLTDETHDCERVCATRLLRAADAEGGMVLRAALPARSVATFVVDACAEGDAAAVARLAACRDMEDDGATTFRWSLDVESSSAQPRDVRAKTDDSSARVYTNVWADVRDVNYVQSYSMNDVQTWMDYDEATIERELGYAEGVGLNAVRVFMGMFPTPWNGCGPC